MIDLLLLGAWRDLRQGWLTFGSCLLLIALSIAVFVSFISASNNLDRSCQELYERLHFEDFSLNVRDQGETGIQRLANLPQVSGLVGRRTLPYVEVFVDQTNVEAMAIGMPSSQRPQVDDVEVTQGSYLGAARGQVLVEERFARLHHLSPGDELDLRVYGGQHKFRIAGLVVSPEFLWLARDRFDPLPSPNRFALIFISEADAESLGGAGFNEIHVRLRDSHRTEEVIKEAEKCLSGATIPPAVARANQPSNALLTRDRRAFAMVGIILPTSLISLASLMLISSIWRLVIRQRRQLGVLMSLGFSRRQLFLRYCMLSAGVALSGGVLGVFLGIPLGRTFSLFYAQSLGIPFTTTWFPWDLGAFSLVGLVAVALGAAYGAASTVLRLDPAAALRADFQPRQIRFLSDSRIPPLLLLVARNLLRQPGRTLLSILGVVVSVAQLMMVLSLDDGQKEALNFYFQKTHRYDFVVWLRGDVAAANLPPWKSWRGVERVESHLRCKVHLRTPVGETESFVWGAPSNSTLVGLYDRDGNSVAPPQGRGLLLGPAMLSRLGVKPGDNLELQLDSSRANQPTLQFQVVGELRTPVPSPPVVALAELQRFFALSDSVPSSAVNTVLFQVDPAYRDIIRRRLSSEPVVYRISSPADERLEVEDLLRMLTAYKFLMLLVSGIFAFIVLASTSSMNVAERARELATMACMGFSFRHLASVVLLELVVIWSGGLLIGAPLGVALGDFAVNNYGSDLIHLEPALNPMIFLQSAFFSLLVSLAAFTAALGRLRLLPLTAANQDRFD